MEKKKKSGWTVARVCGRVGRGVEGREGAGCVDVLRCGGVIFL